MEGEGPGPERLFKEKGTQEDGLSQKSPRRLPAQPIHLSLHVSLHYGFCI